MNRKILTVIGTVSLGAVLGFAVVKSGLGERVAAAPSTESPGGWRKIEAKVVADPPPIQGIPNCVPAESLELQAPRVRFHVPDRDRPEFERLIQGSYQGEWCAGRLETEGGRLMVWFIDVEDVHHAEKVIDSVSQLVSASGSKIKISARCQFKGSCWNGKG